MGKNEGEKNEVGKNYEVRKTVKREKLWSGKNYEVGINMKWGKTKKCEKL